MREVMECRSSSFQGLKTDSLFLMVAFDKVYLKPRAHLISTALLLVLRKARSFWDWPAFQAIFEAEAANSFPVGSRCTTTVQICFM
jgi:hypothetical protein